MFYCGGGSFLICKGYGESSFLTSLPKKQKIKFEVETGLHVNMVLNIPRNHKAYQGRHGLHVPVPLFAPRISPWWLTVSYGQAFPEESQLWLFL